VHAGPIQGPAVVVEEYANWGYAHLVVISIPDRPREKGMRELHAQLSPNEEVALRRVALGFSHGVASAHIRRLKDLHLIEADKTSWRLTALGQQRYGDLPRAAKLASDGTPDAIATMLSKFTKRRERDHS
jgi:hypothetical protein